MKNVFQPATFLKFRSFLMNPKENRRLCVMTNRLEKIQNRKVRLFEDEQKKQTEAVGRIEKLLVDYVGVPENIRLAMNKNLSTPYNCAQHMTETVIKESALALVNGELWDMHRPLEADCRLEFLNFSDLEPHHVNKAYWRTCSLILGAVAERSFQDNIKTKVHSFPPPNVRNGSFVYDVEIGVENWNPTQDELRILTSEMVKFCSEEHKIERLLVSEELALEMFSDNKYKLKQIPNISLQSPTKKITVYKLGDYVDISRGPLVANTSFVGRCTITAIHPIVTDFGVLYRFQGVSLPRGIMLNHFAYSILENRARKLNPGRIPSSQLQTDIFNPVQDKDE